MKYYKLTTYILLSSLIWISCSKDKNPPTITINNPGENATFVTGDELSLDILIEDDRELSHVDISVIDENGNADTRSQELSGMSQNVIEDFTLDFTSSGPFSVLIKAFDESGKMTEIERSHNFLYILSEVVYLNFKLEYQGEPLVIFNDYDYPDGKKINFTRVSFYMSDLKLDETVIEDIGFYNLTNAHASPELAEKGLLLVYPNVPTGNYSEISFNIGVPPELNSMDPGEFPSGHPLAKPAENWFSWQSYIFMKIEGNIDFDNDGEKESSFALHTGSDEALRNIKIDYPVEVTEVGGPTVNLKFDLYDLFNGTERIYPIEEYPQIHSLTQLDGVIELSNNLIYSIDKS